MADTIHIIPKPRSEAELSGPPPGPIAPAEIMTAGQITVNAERAQIDAQTAPVLAADVERPRGPEIPDWMRDSEVGSPAWKKLQKILAEQAAAEAPQGPTGGEAARQPVQPVPTAAAHIDDLWRQQQEINAADARRRASIDQAHAAQGLVTGPDVRGDLAGAAAQAAARSAVAPRGPGAPTAIEGPVGGPVGGPGGGAAGAAAGAVQVATELNKKVVQGVEAVGDFGARLASARPEDTARAFLDLAKVVPITGDQLGALGRAAIEVNGAITAEARRLADYSGDLSSLRAEISVRSLERDMDRADRNAPQYARAMEAEDQFNAAMLEIKDKWLPKLVELSTTGLRVVENVARTGDAALQALMQLIEYATRPIGEQNLPEPLRRALEYLRRIASNTDQEGEAFNPRDFSEELRATQIPDDPAARAQQQELRRQQQNRPPMFPGMG